MGNLNYPGRISLILSIAIIFSFSAAFSENIILSEKTNRIILVEDNFTSLVFNQQLGKIRTMTVNAEGMTFTELLIPGFSSSEITGSPKLPVNRKLIEVPSGAVPSVKILRSVVREIDLKEMGITARIIPDQPPLPKDGSYVEFAYDKEAYSKDIYYYDEPVSVDVLGYLRGLQIGRLNIAPVQYNPVKHTLRIIEEIEFEVLFEGADIQLSMEERARNNNPYFRSLSRQFINHQPLKPVNRDTVANYPIKYLIISDPMFSDQLQPFIEWKTQKGFTVIEAYTDDPSVGNTTLSIKAYIEGLYNAGTPEDPAPSFVLFVGDVDQIPAWSGNAGYHVTDLYYCEFTGDEFPEMYYGRFSAQNTSQLQPQIDKTLQYEKYEMPDPSYLDEVLMVAGMDSGHGYDWANGQINYGTENYFNLAHGITSHTYLYPSSGSQSAAIRQNVSDGVSFGNYTAHCSASGWADPSFNTSHVPALQNADKYCLLVGNCCSSSAFDADACFAEALLRAEDKGALGYIGGSNSTYWDEDYYFGIGVGPISEDPPSYEETTLGYYDRTFHDHGEPFSDWYTTQDQMIFAGNLAVTEGVPSSSVYYWEIYCLMGDPSLMVYFSQPDTLTVSYSPMVPLGSPSFTITTEPYAYAAVSMDGSLISAALADENGIASLDLSSAATPGEADVVITKQNAQPFFGTVMIQNPDGPYVILSDFNVSDTSAGNGNGQADYGENVNLDVELENIGSEDAEDVSATLTTESPWVTITDDYELFGTIPVSATVAHADAYAFEVADSIPDQENVLFDLIIQDSTRLTWNSTLSVTLNAPVLAFGEIMIIDTLTGNGNGRLDAGETSDILIGLMNNGHSDALNTVVELISSSPDITINNALFSLDTLTAMNTEYAIFNVTVAEAVPNGTSIDLNKMAQAGPYSIEEDFYLVAGQIPVLVLDFDKNHNSADAIMTCLGNLGVAAELHTDFPDDMGLFMSAFVCLGIYDDNYVLSGNDGDILADYLDNGGMLYMEGGDTWYYDQQTAVHPMFRIDGISDGSDDLSTILGTPSGFCAEMWFNYIGDNNYIDHIENLDSAFLLFENNPDEYYNGVAYDAGTYKTIGVSFEFGGLEDGDYTKDELMQSFLDFFGIESLLTGIDDIHPDGHLAMTIYPNPVPEGNTYFKIILEKESQINLRIYNAMGQIVDKISVSRTLAPGTSIVPVSTEHLRPGVYHCVLTSEGQQVSGKFVKMK